MKQKLLILIDTMKPMIDGVSIFLEKTLPFLKKKFDITIIAPHYSDERYEGAKLITFPLQKIGDSGYGTAKTNKRILKNEVKNCDIVFNHESASPLAPSFYALKYARRYKKPFFTYVHSIDWELFPASVKIPKFIRNSAKFFLKIFVRWFLSNKNNVNLVSFPTIKKMLIDINLRGKIEIVPIGISDCFKAGTSKYPFKEKIVIGYVGRIGREKGLDILLEKFLKLKSKYKNLLLVIVGEGPIRNMFEGKKDIIVTGFVNQNEVAEYFKAMDIFVLPSITEANSLSTLEALKSGTCCLIRDVGAIKDYLKSGENGYLFNTNNELENLLEKLIKNKELRQKMGDKAAKSVNHLTWKNTTDKLIEVFKKYKND